MCIVLSQNWKGVIRRGKTYDKLKSFEGKCCDATKGTEKEIIHWMYNWLKIETKINQAWNLKPHL